jgi:hypothetical protein
MYRTIVQGKTPRIRKLPAIEALDEGIGMAIETGRKVHAGNPQGTLLGDKVAENLMGFSLMGHFATKAAKAGVPAIYTTPAAQSLPLMEGLIRDAYMTMGKLDLYGNPEFVQIRALTGAYDFALAQILQRENVGASFLAGEIGKIMMFVGESHRVANTFSVLAHPGYDKLEWAVPTFDYVLMLQETYAATAMITEDKAQLGAVLGLDFSAWTIIILTVVIAGTALTIGNLTFLTG